MDLLADEITKEMNVSLACFTHIGRVRKSNQDAFIITDLTETVSISSPGRVAEATCGASRVTTGRGRWHGRRMSSGLPITLSRS
jgi:hypothetical protein